jgi:hypothetical protein
MGWYVSMIPKVIVTVFVHKISFVVELQVSNVQKGWFVLMILEIFVIQLRVELIVLEFVRVFNA